MLMYTLLQRHRNSMASIVLAILLPLGALPAQEKSLMEVHVRVDMDKLPVIKQQRMKDFQEKVSNYLNKHRWIEEENVPPFKVAVQMFLEDRPSNIEDRYKCNLVISGPDIQYVDERLTFAFQEGEPLEHDGQPTSLKLALHFYIYLIIAGEFDKLGYLEGSPYFTRARQAVEQGQFMRFTTGWDRRKELMESIETENYKRFREMKDYYFYALAIVDEDISKAREYMLQAIGMLRDVVLTDRKLLPARDFIGAHYQEILEIFKDSSNKEAIRILLELDPDRETIYKKYL